MPDPYAPKGWPRTAAGEVRSELDQFTQRLRQLGATDDEVAAVAEHWDDLEPDDAPDDEHGPAFTRAYRSQLVRMGDHELRRLLLTSRAEQDFYTTTEDDEAQAAADAEAAAAYRLAMEQAAERIGGTVGAVLGWVADDPVRAQAVHQLETGPNGAGRKTLVEPLEQLLQEAATDAVEPVAASDGPEGPDTPPDPAEAATGDQGGQPAIPEPAPATPRPGDDTGTR